MVIYFFIVILGNEESVGRFNNVFKVWGIGVILSEES